MNKLYNYVCTEKELKEKSVENKEERVGSGDEEAS